MSGFEGKSITAIKPMGGLTAEQPKTYQLWVTGGVVSVIREEDVVLVDEILEDFKALEPGIKACAEHFGERYDSDEEVKKYLRHRLMEAGW